MKVNSYKIESKEIAEVIEKLAEADGCASTSGTLEYLKEAASLLMACALNMQEEYFENGKEID